MVKRAKKAKRTYTRRAPVKAKRAAPGAGGRSARIETAVSLLTEKVFELTGTVNALRSDLRAHGVAETVGSNAANPTPEPESEETVATETAQ